MCLFASDFCKKSLPQTQHSALPASFITIYSSGSKPWKWKQISVHMLPSFHNSVQKHTSSLFFIIPTIGLQKNTVFIMIDMPTTESISTMVNYTLWVCCNQPRATFNHRVKHQTFQTKFLCKTINTARFLKASAFFTAIICPFWFKTSKVMTLLTFCINNHRPIDGKTLFSICNQR